MAKIRSPADGPLFLGLGNRNRRGRLMNRVVYSLLCKRAQLAGRALREWREWSVNRLYALATGDWSFACKKGAWGREQ